MDIEIGDILLCTVDRIVGTVVFVKIEGEKREGSIILSEVAPGRIRNLRAHVVPKKKIACKVLRISQNRIDLSLRRVTQKEKKEIIELFKQEKSYKSIFKSILKENSEKIIEEIKKNQPLYEFIEEIKENSKILEEKIGKEDSEKILKILKTQKNKKVSLKKIIHLKTNNPNGLEIIKKVLGQIKDAKVSFISAGKYSLEVESEQLKEADQKLKSIISQLEENSKKEDLILALK